MIVFRKNNDIIINRDDKLTINDVDIAGYEKGYCKEFIDNYFDIINGEVIFWDLQKRYDNNVLDISPYQKVFNNQIVAKSEDELLEDGLIALEQIKAEKLTYWSNYSMTFRQQKYPDYKLINAGIGIYPDTEKEKIKTYCDNCRNEFYRMKNIIDNATTLTEINSIEWSLT